MLQSSINIWLPILDVLVGKRRMCFGHHVVEHLASFSEFHTHDTVDVAVSAANAIVGADRPLLEGVQAFASLQEALQGARQRSKNADAGNRRYIRC